VDGSTHVATIYGEAMDSGDKATNKAMSAAYKYLCLQSFCIPVVGEPDADSETHEVASQKKPEKPEAKAAFESEELRKTFIANVSDSIAKAETLEKLEQIISLNMAKITAMKNGNDADKDAAKYLSRVNAARKAELAVTYA